MRVQLSSVGERSSVVLCRLDVSLSLRQALALSLARHLMEVLPADQTKDEEKNQEILAALSKCWNTGMLEIILVRHGHFFR